MVRVGLIRRLEAQGIRLEDIARALTASAHDCAEAANEEDRERGPTGEASAAAVGRGLSLTELEEQVRALREVAARADPRALGVLAALTTRAQALIATAVLLAGELLSDFELPPL